jgi:hypothetical protein
LGGSVQRPWVALVVVDERGEVRRGGADGGDVRMESGAKEGLRW